MQETDLKFKYRQELVLWTRLAPVTAYKCMLGSSFAWPDNIIFMHMCFLVDIATSYDFDMSTTVIMVMPTVGKAVLCIYSQF